MICVFSRVCLRFQLYMFLFPIAKVTLYFGFAHIMPFQKRMWRQR